MIVFQVLQMGLLFLRKYYFKLAGVIKAGNIAFQFEFFFLVMTIRCFLCINKLQTL